MSPNERLLHSQATLIRISVITGWNMPQNALQDILVDQFIKKMTETYPTVNPDEMEYAFRTYGTVVKDWGKQINLSLIDEVMAAYLGARKEVSAKEEQRVPLLDAPRPEADLSDRAMGDWLEDLRKKVNAGGYSVQFIPLMLYDWLDKRKMLKTTVQEKYDYLDKAVAYTHGSMVEYLDKTEDTETRRKLAEFNAMKAEGCFQGEWIDRLKNLSKRMLLYDFLLTKK